MYSKMSRPTFWKHGEWVLAKKMFAYKYNSYVVSTERETKNLQPELSHRFTLAHAST